MLKEENYMPIRLNIPTKIGVSLTMYINEQALKGTKINGKKISKTSFIIEAILEKLNSK